MLNVYDRNGNFVGTELTLQGTRRLEKIYNRIDDLLHMLDISEFTIPVGMVDPLTGDIAIMSKEVLPEPLERVMVRHEMGHIECGYYWDAESEILADEYAVKGHPELKEWLMYYLYQVEEFWKWSPLYATMRPHIQDRMAALAKW